MQTADIPVEFYKLYFQLSGAFIAVLIAIIAYFIKAGFTKQEKKDAEQDVRMDDMHDNMDRIFTKLTDAVVRIERATEVQRERLDQNAKEISKHDRLIEHLLKTTK